jgi:hypothetical protein
MGGTTCHFSSGGGKKKHDDHHRNGEGVEIIVDTRTSSATGTAALDTGGFEATVVRAALAASVMPLSFFETSDGSDPVTSPLDLEEPAGTYVAISRVGVTGTAVTPEPTAAIVFVTGTVLLVWQLRRRRSA